MDNYKYTREEIETAHNTDLVSFLENRGEKITTVGSHNYWMHDGETVSISNNLWFNHYTQEGGEAIGFIRAFFGTDFCGAVGMLLGESIAQMQEREKPVKPKEPFKLPERNDDMRRAYGYLVKTRGIDKDVVSTFMRCGQIYEDAKHHNVVFAGFDRTGKPRHAHMRGTGTESKFKMTSPRSEPEYSFHWNGRDNEIFLFEAPIDMLSYISMYPSGWMNHSYAAACSVADRVLFQCLKDNPNIDTVHICFDNDMAGQSAAFKLTGKLNEQGYRVNVIVPEHKDWNEDLTTPVGMQVIGNGIKID